MDLLVNFVDIICLHLQDYSCFHCIQSMVGINHKYIHKLTKTCAKTHCQQLILLLQFYGYLLKNIG
jgi:hypothetical protein